MWKNIEREANRSPAKDLSHFDETEKPPVGTGALDSPFHLNGFSRFVANAAPYQV